VALVVQMKVDVLIEKILLQLNWFFCLKKKGIFFEWRIFSGITCTWWSQWKLEEIYSSFITDVEQIILSNSWSDRYYLSRTYKQCVESSVTQFKSGLNHRPGLGFLQSFLHTQPETNHQQMSNSSINQTFFSV
jgi:hypothetical protein